MRLIRSTRLVMAAVALLLSGTAVAQQQVSPRDQLKQYVADLQRNPSDDALREKIIKLALTLEPKPKLPPEVDELVGRGEHILQQATSDADLQAAADAFEKASLLAPWVPDYYFDQGVVWEKAKNYEKAIKNFELYLLGVPPDSDDARKARQHLGSLKYELERQQAANTAAQARAQAELNAARELEQRRRAQMEYQSRLGWIDGAIWCADTAAGYCIEVHGDEVWYGLRGGDLNLNRELDVKWKHPANDRHFFAQSENGCLKSEVRLSDDGNRILEKSQSCSIGNFSLAYIRMR